MHTIGQHQHGMTRWALRLAVALLAGYVPSLSLVPGTAARPITSFCPFTYVTLDDVSVLARTQGTTTAVVTVHLSRQRPQGCDVTLQYHTQDGQDDAAATASEDYVPIANGSLSIPAGAVSGRIFITINANTEVEPEEHFSVLLTAANFAQIIDSEAVVTIIDPSQIPGHDTDHGGTDFCTIFPDDPVCTCDPLDDIECPPVVR